MDPPSIEIDGGSTSPPRAAKRPREEVTVALESLSANEPILVIGSPRARRTGFCKRLGGAVAASWASGEEDILMGALLLRVEVLTEREATGKRVPPEILKQAARHVRGPVAMYLVYTCLGAVCVATEAPCQTLPFAGSLQALAARFRPSNSGAEFLGKPLKEYLVEWEDAFGRLEGLATCRVRETFGQHLLSLASGSIFFAVGIHRQGGRFRHYLLGKYPSKKTLHRYMKSVPTDIRGGARGNSLRKKAYRCDFSAEEFVEWLTASAGVKSLRKMPQAQRAWSRILARKCGYSCEDMDRVRQPSYELLRRIRVRFDLTMMLMHRYAWRATVDADTDIVIWVDASPQWRGREMYAASYDAATFDSSLRPSSVRRLFPVLSVGSHLRALRGKAYAFLWQVAMVVGFDYGQMRRYLRRVRGITTDFGTEHLLRDAPDWLHDFLLAHGACVPLHAKKLPFLFERALLCPGFHHICDGLVRYGLCSLRWFPVFLTQLKALLRFVRASREDLVALLITKNRLGLASTIRSLKVTTFTHWRWGKLSFVTDTLVDVLSSLQCEFQQYKELLVKSRDRAWAKAVNETMESHVFTQQFLFVHWFCGWLGRLERWAGSCPCQEHRERHARTAPVECRLKGRLLHLAWAKVTEAHDGVLREIGQWDAGTFGMGLTMLRECQGATRAVCVRLLLKFGYLDQLPYKLAGGLDRDVLRQCVAQFDAIPEHRHDRVTLEFLSQGRPLRRYVDEFLSVAHEAPRPLRREILGLQQLVLDDTPAEGPHAAAHQQEVRARASSWPWQSSTLRLKDNLADYEQHSARFHVDFQTLWDNYKMVLNPRSERPVRKTHLACCKKIYTLFMDLHPFPGRSGGDVAEDEEPLPLVDHGVHRPALKHEPYCGEEQLLREWLEHVVDRFQFVSFSTPHAEVKLELYQVLDYARPMKTVQTAAPLPEERVSSLFWNMQRFELWRGADVTDSTTELYAFTLEAPARVDIFRVLGRTLEDRPKVKVWSETESDLEGTICLCGPVLPRPSLALSASGVPLACLLDEICAQGFRRHHAKVVHKNGGLRRFDARKLVRPYLQVVLSLRWLYSRGVEAIPSDKPAAFYLLLLKRPEDRSLFELSGKELKARLAVEGGSEGVPEALDLLAGVDPLPLPLACELDGDGGDGDDESPIHMEIGEAKEVLGTEVDGECCDDDLEDFPREVAGGVLHREDNISAVTGAISTGLRIICPHHGYPCRKYQSMQKGVGAFGRYAAAYFLGAWAERASCFDDAADHVAYNPSHAEVAARKAAHPVGQ